MNISKENLRYAFRSYLYQLFDMSRKIWNHYSTPKFKMRSIAFLTILNVCYIQDSCLSY